MAKPLIRLLVVDDHELVRTGLASLLSRSDGIHVVGALATGEDALRDIEALRPDVVLLDYRLPGINGAIACAGITERHPEISVVILTTYMDDEIIHSCLVAGARGFLLKDASLREIVEAIKTVSCNEFVLAPQVTEKVVSWARRSKYIIQGYESLDELERTVLRLVSEGVSNPMIAAQLRCSAQSIELELRSIITKLKVTEVSEAVAVGIRRGLI